MTNLSPSAQASVHYESSVFNNEHEWQAGGEGESLEQVRQAGAHFLAMYSQDGPHYLELREVWVLPAIALPIPEETDG